ncbi:hypothetical protein FRC19_006424 [Serendipita sp. 401]|nr:hypothetical protein FRC19_006424 [Serendipita sp. 401]
MSAEPLRSPTRSYDVPLSGKPIRCPLSFNEDTLTKAHILALFVPNQGTEGRHKILSTIQCVLGLLPDQFSLQSEYTVFEELHNPKNYRSGFIELVDQEKWDDEAANFIATRQTLLALLVSQAGEFSKQPTALYDEVIVDLSDPVLLGTGMVPVLLDMVLCEFLSSNTNRRKLIVVNDAQEYLTPDSILTKSLTTLASLGNRRPASVIVTATNPHTLPPSLYYAFDFLALGHTRSITWQNILRNHLDTSFPDDLYVPPGKCALYSPESCRATVSRRGEMHTAQWGKSQIVIDLDELVNVSVHSPFLSDIQASTQLDNAPEESLDAVTPLTAISPLPYVKVTSTSITKDVREVQISDADYHLLSTDEGPNSRDSTDNNSVMQPPDHEYTSSVSITDLKSVPEPTSTRTINDAEGGTGSPILSSTGDLHRTSVPLLLESVDVNNKESPLAQTIPPEVQDPGQETITLDIDDYPQQFHRLISAIIAVGGGLEGAVVDFEAVRKETGTRAQVQKLGWCTFTQFVNGAKAQRLVDVSFEASGKQMIKLLPRPRPEAIVSRPPVEEVHHVADRVLGSDDHSHDATAAAVVVESHMNPPKPSDPLPSLDQYLKDMTLPPVHPELEMDRLSESSLPVSMDISFNSIGPGESPHSGSVDVILTTLVGVYPAKYRLLATAILRITGNRFETRADFEAVRKLMGTKEDIRALHVGFMTFTQMVNSACAEHHVQRGIEAGKEWLLLLEKTTPSGTVKLAGLRPLDYPPEHEPVVAAILHLTSGCALVRAEYSSVVSFLAKQRSIGSSMAGEILLQAIKDEVVQIGFDLNVHWVALEPPRGNIHVENKQSNVPEHIPKRDLSRFEPLLAAFKKASLSGQLQLSFCQLGTLLDGGWKQKGKVKTLTEYVELAQNEGLVTIGGIKAQQWARLVSDDV